MPFDKYVFAQKIRAARLSRNISQARLAEEIGVSPSTIAMYETGQRFPVLDNLDALADALNLPMSYFVETASFANQPSLTPDEDQLLTLYRSLNQSGRVKLNDYARDLSENPRYQKNTPASAI